MCTFTIRLLRKCGEAGPSWASMRMIVPGATRKVNGNVVDRIARLARCILLRVNVHMRIRDDGPHG